jgi:hypothetical protein
VDRLVAVALSEPNNLCSQLELDELLKYGDMSELGKYVGTTLKTGLVKFNFFLYAGQVKCVTPGNWLEDK